MDTFVFTAMLMPTAAVLAICLLEWSVGQYSWQEWLETVGRDCYILSWGALGGVFANDNIRKHYSGQHAYEVEFLCLILLMCLAAPRFALWRNRTGSHDGSGQSGSGGGGSGQRQSETITGWEALASLAIGGFALVVPGMVAMHAHL